VVCGGGFKYWVLVWLSEGLADRALIRELRYWRFSTKSRRPAGCFSWVVAML
jgi:hypothetical protein